MKKSPINLLKASLIFYSLILTFCNTDKSPLTDDKIRHYLADKYEGIILTEIADAFSTKSVFSILQTTTILDTVIFSAGTDIDGYFLKAFVKDHKSKNVFAQFYCSKNVYDEYIASQTTHFLTAVRIKEYNECQTYIDLETIDNELLTLPGKRKIILTGECLEIIETGRG